MLSFELPDTIDDDDSGLLLGTFGKDLPEGGGRAEEMLGLLASDSSDDGEDGERRGRTWRKDEEDDRGEGRVRGSSVQRRL